MVKVHRTGIVLKPDARRVLFRPFYPTNDERALRIVTRVLALTDDEVKAQFDHVLSEFSERHRQLREWFLERWDEVRNLLRVSTPVNEARRALLGAYFTHEYSFESTALFNPSMVWHPDQSNLEEGSRRFVISLRGIGEGHISSIAFRTGVVTKTGDILVDPAQRFVKVPAVVPTTSYDKKTFARKLVDLGLMDASATATLSLLSDEFQLSELEDALARVVGLNPIVRSSWPFTGGTSATARSLRGLAMCNYEVAHNPNEELSERVLFPVSPTESNGMEDARFVEFQHEEGSCYYATYTAYNGSLIMPQLIETRDFSRFKMASINGPAATNKGMALFPRKIDGLYAMISRQDNENIYIMFSDDVCFWHDKSLLITPHSAWEFVQLGNCGSPIETEAGWLVLTHGVGAMRKYAIGAVLLDLENPRRVIGRLNEPLISPDSNEREGYVPNVVYSCGALVHQGELIIPYAMSDYASTFAKVNLDELLTALRANP